MCSFEGTLLTLLEEWRKNEKEFEKRQGDRLGGLLQWSVGSKWKEVDGHFQEEDDSTEHMNWGGQVGGLRKSGVNLSSSLRS